MICPRKRYVTTVKVQGHTWEDVIRTLEIIVDEARAHGEECGLITSGDGSGWIDTQIDRAISKEDYDKGLEEWMENRRKTTVQ